MERFQVVAEILRMFPGANYLEIGVDAGETFHALQAATKTAVDPAFKFPIPANQPGSGVAYHPITSDAFFAALSPASRKFDVVYVDGLHTFEQVLRDVLNAAENLAPWGVIVVDDITPNSYHAALPSLGEAFTVRDHVRQWHPELLNDATWMGDVYKLAFFAHSFMQSFSFATVAENHGQLVLWRAARDADELGSRTVHDVAALEFKHVVLARDTFNIMSLGAIIAAIRARPGFTPAA